MPLLRPRPHRRFVKAVQTVVLAFACSAAVNGAPATARPESGRGQATTRSVAPPGPITPSPRWTKDHLAAADRQALIGGNVIEVIVEFEHAQADDVAANLRRRQGLAHDDEDIQNRKAALYRTGKDRVFDKLAADDVQLLQDYDQLPLAHFRVATDESLEALAQLPEIKAVYSNRRLRPMLAESLPLIAQPQAASQGYTGAGAAVAVLDTGVDYTRAAFGSCSAPGGSCKVVYARDFAPDDGALDDDDHGTNVSATVLGVAPDARIVGLDVFRTDGFAYDSDSLAAINWVIANRATYNIVAMNLSLGGGRYYAECPSDSWASALANARSAGILVAAAAGNEGYKNSISAPACTPAAVSVGAVYDSRMSGISWSNCTDSQIVADQVTCFSNSADFLDLLAPGARITAAGITMGGTSQATPHVAGAAAVLRAAFPSDSVDDTLARLTNSGAAVSDTNQITKPRIDLAAALDVSVDAYTLSVAMTGSGSGTIVSTPSGIDCGTQCDASFPTGTAVTLTATPTPSSTFNGWSGACSGTGTCVVTMNAARQVSADFSASSNLGFADALDNADLQWQTQGDAAWRTVILTDRDAAISGDVGHNQSSMLKTSVTGPGTVGFLWRVSSEAGYDFLEFRVDDVLIAQISGEVSWQPAAYAIGAGMHTLSWIYRKDDTVSDGDDAGGLDAVTFSAAAVPLPDLAITQITAPDAGVQGQEVDVSLSVSNGGSVNAGPFIVGIYLSTDAAITKTDLDTGSYCSFTSLDAGASSTCSGALTIPTSVASGTYYFGAYADAADQITEFDEINNGRAADNTIVISNTSAPLAVTLHGGGRGRVTSTPAGIDCGTDCNATYPFSTTVTLAATPDTGSAFAGWGDDCAAAGGCSLAMNSVGSVTATFVPDDLDEAFPPAGRWPSGWKTAAAGNGAWYVTNAGAHEGAYSLRSAPLSDDESSIMEIERDFAAGNVAFSLRVSSEADFDYLIFYIDGIAKRAWSGEVPWTEASFPVSAGHHALRWSYEKDVSVASGSDRAWIDAVSLPDAGTGGISVSVALTGTGTGTVISNPLGIHCGADCSERMEKSGVVSLYAVPAPGSAFVGWSGPCSGAGRICTFTADSTTAVSAQFGSGTASLYTALIEHYYENILGRGSDAGGLNFWLDEIVRMQALQVDLKEAYRVLAGYFVFSDEFSARGTTDGEYLTALYRTFFDRAPDAGGLNFWTDQLNQGLPRSVVLFAFLFSTEYSNYMRNYLGDFDTRGEVSAIVDFYRGFLGRLPDSDGFAYWLNRFRTAQCQGVTQVNAEVEAISSQFYGSTEYADRARADKDYVADLYYAFMRRGGELDGFQHWLHQLQSGTQSRDQLRGTFIQSTEFQQRVGEILQEICLLP